MKKTGQFQKSGGNNQRRNPNRQENSSGRKPNQNQNQNKNPNSGPRKGAIHPWASSSAASSQALTSHISMASRNSSGNSNNRNKPQSQNKRNHSGPRRDNEQGNTGGAKFPNKGRFDKARQKNGQNASPANPAAETNRAPAGSVTKVAGKLDSFSLFCAYHLGIGPNKEYKPSNINEVARRFGEDQAVVKQALKECDMDSASLLDKDFDMALAQLDIQVAPEGIDRMELAKSIYEDFLAAPHVKRDWNKILDEDRKENKKVFGGV